MTTVDLFAGCGGLSQGFQNAGFDIVAAFEFWDTAVKCYKENYTHPVYQMDLAVEEEIIPILKNIGADLIIGGPPCQDFSHAGKRIESDRANLTCSFAQIIASVRPRYFVMENVDRAMKSNSYTQAKQIFRKAGYGLIENVLDASKCGVPQKRKRLFCIGALGKEDNFINPPIQTFMSKKPTTLKDYFGDNLDFEYYYRHPRNYNRRGIFSIYEPAPTMRGVNRPVPQGYPGHPNDPCLVNENLRSLTTLERAAIQTFPDGFKWTGSKTEMEQMIGNAVPVKLAEFVATYLKNYIDNSSFSYNENSFKQWLLEVKHYSDRSAKDTISRIRRCFKISESVFSPDDYKLYLFNLDQSPQYNQIPVSVKSQLKRSIVLLAEYCSSKAVIQ